MKKRLSVLAMAAILLGVFLTGCGKSTVTSEGDSSGESSTQATTATTSDESEPNTTESNDSGQSNSESSNSSSNSSTTSKGIGTTTSKVNGTTTKAPTGSGFDGEKVIRESGAGTFANLAVNAADPYYLKKNLGAALSINNPATSDGKRVFEKDGTWLYDKGVKFTSNGTIYCNDTAECFAINTKNFIDGDGAWTVGASFRTLGTHDNRDPETQPICSRIMICDSTQKEVFMVTINLIKGRGEDGAEDPNSNQIYYKVQLLAGTSWRDILVCDNWTATRSNQFYFEISYNKAVADNKVHLKIVGDQGNIVDTDSVVVIFQ